MINGDSIDDDSKQSAKQLLESDMNGFAEMIGDIVTDHCSQNSDGSPGNGANHYSVFLRDGQSVWREKAGPRHEFYAG